ncbi:MAG TPA: ATPase, T2SS/T4P/T4SS family [Acidimicrobiia bacterium]|nr:ATPase, T2SS/T4P/T4SS family [Acidimicrobiia bacterium]
MSPPLDSEIAASARPAPTTDRPADRRTHDDPTTGSPRLGELLLAAGLIDHEHLDAALNLQRQTGLRIGESLVKLGFVSSYDVTRIMAQRIGVAFIDLDETPVDHLVVQSVPEEVARRYHAIPIARRDDGVVVAMGNPQDVFAIDDLGMLLRASVIPMMADPEQLGAMIERAWSGSSLANHVDEATQDAVDDEDPSAGAVAVVDDAPVVRVVDAVLANAIDERASDVHLEPGPDRVRVRFRVDGVLHDASELPANIHRSVMSRLKIIAGMDITQTRLPNDGRFSVSHGNRQVDVRVATLPTAHGEAAVLRLLDQSSGVIALESLGFTPAELERYEAAFRRPQGAILASGPTGSGKTSTLYATLVEINEPDRSIIAVEDPIEYQVDGIKQIQIDLRVGLTFPTALRSILRADPDVILVGEIRDLETARIAAEAALTGHLVLSTIHTTRAAAVPLRLLDMGVEPFLVTSALTCVVGQRLVRRLCTRCSEPYSPDHAARESFGLSDEILDADAIRRPVGCSHCNGTGYRDRVAIYEIMPMTDDIARLVLARQSSQDIERWAVAEGMDTLRTAALRRVADGVTSIDEMLRVVV